MSATLDSLVGDFIVAEKSVTIGAGVIVPILAQSGERWSFIFGTAPSGGAITVSTNQAVLTTQGYQISAGNLPFEKNFRDHGGLVSVPWFARGVAGASVLTVIEVLYRPTGPTINLDDVIKELNALKRNSQWNRDQYTRLQQLLRVPA